MTRTEAKENAIATAQWLKDEGASTAEIFTFLATVLNHAMAWADTKVGHAPISEVHTKLEKFAFAEK